MKVTAPTTERLSGMGKVFAGFKDFIARGNAIELAVGVVIGAAFGAVVAALQTALITPIIGWLFGKPDLTHLWDITLPELPWAKGVSVISVGAVLNALLNFLLVAAAIYFLIVVPLNSLAARRKKGEEAEPAAPAEDILLLQEIRDLLAQRITPAVANDATGPVPVTPDDPPHPGGPVPPSGPTPPPSIPPGS